MSDNSKKRRSQYTTDKIKTLNHVVDHWNPWGLKGIHLAVWTVLYRHERNSLSTVSRSVIIKTLGADKRVVRDAINRLVEERVISVHKKGKPGTIGTTYCMEVVEREDVFEDRE